MMKNNIIGIIPARGGSNRLKGKNIKPLCGKPLLAYTIEAALKAKQVDRVIVSTDNERIAETAIDWGTEVIMRPAELATSFSPIDDALRHVISELAVTENYRTDIAVLMQANLPIRADGLIDQVIAKLIETGAETVCSAYAISEHPEWMKRLINDRVEPYLPLPEHYRTQDLEKLYLTDGAATAVRAETLMRTRDDRRAHAWMGVDVRLVIQDRIYAVEIDDSTDMLLAECILEKLSRQLP